jgi:hypothetical protein
MRHDAVLMGRVRSLRSEGRTPKEVARALGLRPAEAAALVRAVAAQASAEPEPAVVACWVSGGVPSADAELDDPDRSGLVGVVVARRGRGRRVSVCGYLVDVDCLGVKNALGPRVMDESDLGPYARAFFDAFDSPPQPATVEVASRLVWGAVDYARGLGFEPHPDFSAAAGHLGERLPGHGIRFGRDGKPFYVQGPHDDAARILRTLDQTVGEGNYRFLVHA